MEPRELGPAEQTMEDMSHLMEERHDIIMPHQRRFPWRRFGQVGNHGSDRVASLAVRALVTG